jgi:hypothetical protein
VRNSDVEEKLTGALGAGLGATRKQKWLQSSRKRRSNVALGATSFNALHSKPLQPRSLAIVQNFRDTSGDLREVCLLAQREKDPKMQPDAPAWINWLFKHDRAR